MTNVNGVHSSAVPALHQAPAISPAAAPAASAAPAQASQIHDSVEMSTVAKLAAKIHDLPDVRAELVERVKAEIASGTYETAERIDTALDRLMDELAG